MQRQVDFAGEEELQGLTIGEAIRRIRRRLNKNTTEFGYLLGSTSASVSRYENGKLNASKPVLRLLLTMAETAEERSPILRALGEEVSVEREQGGQVISEIRKASGMSSALFAAVLGCSETDLHAMERGEAHPDKDLVERLHSVAARIDRADLAVSLSSGSWLPTRVIYPGETLISTGRIASRKDSKYSEWHTLLEEILSSGEEDAIVAVQHNLVVFGNYVRTRKSHASPSRRGPARNAG
jgi:DNA-binding transcriptional regulator YiaG